MSKMIHNKYFEVMKHFLRGYNSSFYGRELAGKVKISQKNIALTLKELEEEGILSSKLNGRSKNYSFNFSNPLIKKYILFLEVENSLKFLKEHKKISQLVEKINQGNIICIFGSYAKGTEKSNSDLDLFIIGTSDGKKIIQEGKSLGIEVNIQSGTHKNFKDLIKNKNPLIKEILENHIILSGYEDFVEEVFRNG